MGQDILYFIQKRKIGGHASSLVGFVWMQFSTNFRPPKTARKNGFVEVKITENFQKLPKNA
jgi:hypothetical protein